MPVYEFQCSQCNAVFEEYFRSASEQKDLSCPSCKSIDIQKLFSAFGTATHNNGPVPPVSGGGGCGCGSGGGCSPSY